MVRDDLDKIIHTSMLTGVGVAVSVPFHGVMRNDSGKFGAIPAVPYRLAFQQVLAECAKAMKVLGRGNMVTFGHDDGNDYDDLRRIYLDFKKANPRYQSVMGDFVPLDDKQHPPVQAADVSASIVRKYAEAYASNPTTDNMKRMKDNMYKIVNWLDNPTPIGANVKGEERPALAKYIA